MGDVWSWLRVMGRHRESAAECVSKEAGAGMPGSPDCCGDKARTEPDLGSAPL